MQAGFKKWLTVGAGFGAGAILMICVVFATYLWFSSRPKPWNSRIVIATFIDSKFTDDHRHLFLAYSLENRTDTDITISESDKPLALVNLEREKSAMQNADVTLEVPLFLPAKRGVLGFIVLARTNVPPGISNTDAGVEAYIRENLSNYAGFSVLVNRLRLEIQFPKPHKAAP